MGFGRAKREGDDKEAINRMFTPEFRNRLDAVITFAGLPPEVIMKVVEKFVFQLEAQLADRGVTIELYGGGEAWLAESGYDEKFGARPLARVIQEHIKKPLADELLFGKLKHGGTVRVLVEAKDGEKKLAFEYLKADTPIRPRDPEDGDPDGDGPTGSGTQAKAKAGTPKPRVSGRSASHAPASAASAPVSCPRSPSARSSFHSPRKHTVMAGLVPAIHVLACTALPERLSFAEEIGQFWGGVGQDGDAGCEVHQQKSKFPIMIVTVDGQSL